MYFVAENFIDLLYILIVLAALGFSIASYVSSRKVTSTMVSKNLGEIVDQNQAQSSQSSAAGALIFVGLVVIAIIIKIISGGSDSARTGYSNTNRIGFAMGRNFSLRNPLLR